MTVSALQLKAKELIIPLREGRPIALDLQVGKLREVQVDDYAPLEKTSRGFLMKQLAPCTQKCSAGSRLALETAARLCREFRWMFGA